MTSMGGATVRPDDFNEARWRRVGADDGKIDQLRDDFMQLSYEDKIKTNTRIAQMPDSELAASLTLPPAPAVLDSAQPATNLADAGQYSPGEADGSSDTSDTPPAQ